MTFCIVLWELVFAASLLHYSLFLVRLSIAFGMTWLYLFLLFAYFFTVKKPNKNIIYGIGISYICIAIFTLTPFVFSHTEYIDGYLMPVFDFGIYIFGPITLLLPIFSLGVLMKNFWSTERYQQLQSYFIVTGFSITYIILFLTNYIAVNVLHTRKYFSLGMLSLFIFIGATAYAMTRYRFLDVKILFKKSMIYGTMLTIYCGVYIGIVFTIYRLVGMEIPLHPFIWLLLSVMGFLYLFELCKLKAKHFLDGIFFREEIDFFKLIHQSKMGLNSIHDLESFVIKLAGSIQEVIQAPVQEILVRQPLTNRFKSFFPRDSKQYIPFDDAVLKEITDLNRPYHFFGELHEQKIAARLQKMMRKKSSYFCMTVNLEGELLAIILIGEHKNNKSFSSLDISGLQEFYELIQRQLPLLLNWQKAVEGTKVFLQNQD